MSLLAHEAAAIHFLFWILHHRNGKITEQQQKQRNILASVNESACEKLSNEAMNR